MTSSAASLRALPPAAMAVAVAALVVTASCQPPSEAGDEVAAARGASTAPAMAAVATSPGAGDGSRDAAGARVTGIDVSWHSGSVDWDAVQAAGHAFAIVKATEGTDLVDRAFHANWSAARGASLVRGAYHFYVTEDDPDAQAQLYLEHVTLEPGDLAPIVDVELIGHGTQPGLADRLRRFLDRLEAATGVKPIVYTSPTFWDEHVGPGFGEHPLWIAEYGVAAPRLPAGWERWHLWQWRGDAAIPGVERTADLSRIAPTVALDSLRLR